MTISIRPLSQISIVDSSSSFLNLSRPTSKIQIPLRWGSSLLKIIEIQEEVMGASFYVPPLQDLEVSQASKEKLSIVHDWWDEKHMDCEAILQCKRIWDLPHRWYERHKLELEEGSVEDSSKVHRDAIPTEDQGPRRIRVEKEVRSKAMGACHIFWSARYLYLLRLLPQDMWIRV